MEAFPGGLRSLDLSTPPSLFSAIEPVVKSVGRVEQRQEMRGGYDKQGCTKARKTKLRRFQALKTGFKSFSLNIHVEFCVRDT